MAKKKSFSLGNSITQALTDTVAAASNYAGELHIEVIPLRKVELDDENPRELALNTYDLLNGISPNDAQRSKKQLEAKSLESMANSIRTHGVINPVTVYKKQEKYRIIAGERRTLASIMAEKDDIPAKILTSRPDVLQLSLLQWIENVEREDLSLWERLTNLEKIVNAHAKQHQKVVEHVTPTELSQLIGCSLQQAINYMHIINASDKLRSMLRDNKITNIEKAAVIAKAPSKLEDSLIQASITGATLKELKKLSQHKAPTILEVTKKQRRGRQHTRINFGSTKKPHVAKIIIQSVLKNNDYDRLFRHLGEIEWNDYKSVSDAFQKIISKLEEAK